MTTTPTRDELTKLLAEPLTEAEQKELRTEEFNVPALHIAGRVLLLYGIAIAGAKTVKELERFVACARSIALLPIFFGNNGIEGTLKILEEKELIRHRNADNLEITESGLQPLNRFSLFLRGCVNRKDVQVALREFAAPGSIKMELLQRLERLSLRDLFTASEILLKTFGK